MTSQQRLSLTIAILASFVSGLDGFIVNVALPAISDDLGGGLSTQQWTVDAYLITLGSVILIAGSLSDLLGRKRILTIGLYWFGITSALCAIAPNGPTLVVARALQGIAGALLVPSSLALIIGAFSGAAQSRAIGTWTGWTTVTAVAGPLVGGILVAVSSWRWIFAINVLPIALTLFLLRALTVREVTRASTRVDLRGAVLCAVGLAGPVCALILEPSRGWGHPLVWLPLVLGCLVFAAFLLAEHRTTAPMLPLTMFRERNVAFGNLATVAIYAGLSASTFIVVIVVQQVVGYSALQAGLVMLPVTAIMFALSGRFGALAGRHGPRLFMTIGPLLGATGFLMLLWTRQDLNYWTQLLPGVLVFGLGLSITVAPLTSAILGSVAEENAGIASAVNNAVSRIAGLVAVALTGLVTGPVLSMAGFHRTLVLIAALLVAGAAISWFGITNSRVDTGQAAEQAT